LDLSKLEDPEGRSAGFARPRVSTFWIRVGGRGPPSAGRRPAPHEILDNHSSCGAGRRPARGGEAPAWRPKAARSDAATSEAESFEADFRLPGGIGSGAFRVRSRPAGAPPDPQNSGMLGERRLRKSLPRRSRTLMRSNRRYSSGGSRRLRNASAADVSRDEDSANRSSR